MVFRQIPEDNVADEGIEQESYARVYKTYDGLISYILGMQIICSVIKCML